MQNFIKLKFLNTKFEEVETVGDKIKKSMIPNGDLFIWGQVPKSEDYPVKIWTFGCLMLVYSEINAQYFMKLYI